MQNELTKKEQRLMRRWFKKAGENTIETQEKKWGFAKAFFMVLIIGWIYYDFIDPRYQESTIQELKFAFQPESRFQKEFSHIMDDNAPNYTMLGETKEEYMARMWERHKGGVWVGYFTVGKYILVLICFLRPTKRRVRFDRKRGIIYTYVNKTFYLTEVNKLMRPFPEYIAFMGGMISFWVHPYQQAKYFANAIRGSQVVISDYTMWVPMIFMMFPGMYQRSKGAVLKRFLVDFMNPDTPPERIASMMKALETRPGIFECLEKILFGWIDGGLYCRKLPKDEVLEKEIEQYFAEQAPHIKALPSFKMGTYDESLASKWKTKHMDIISVEDNIKAGYGIMPCPNLYEYPIRSLHYNQFGIAWGNEAGDMEQFPKSPGKWKSRKLKLKNKK
ncbi:hypothetical protein HYE54_08450 [Aggregatibacter actinomycetemcomitans]|uniref:hypothetical protein n=1 Tax=Aggregatibacter actinomycetemcomitans TaxID=714 RepID=UPI00197C32F5|nr:hypothetical protein [Aggregatibacter actinomycetemcomitans]MBN6067455.1 hypothetical protein [Aggregatibacter actinomycetemcomitans]MBN6067553.1 hypothetical protein [Aggregatibacter actinomycetemcomitans]MBN6068761.1 hypothetical protein [Aggregatibacter actinomycetemcomitans]MBN6085492.1 hypothetical protein [Aggregatibacter actinomycetemcomitans]MBN6085499.1 hypothetical protein [Aggregatibacter actinomycetemcomitans]